MDNIDKFLELFSDFELVIVPKQERKREPAPVESLQKTKASLKKALKRLEREYKQALRSFKMNKISKSEPYEFEWRIFEIQEELNKLDSNEE